MEGWAAGSVRNWDGPMELFGIIAFGSCQFKKQRLERIKLKRKSEAVSFPVVFASEFMPTSFLSAVPFPLMPCLLDWDDESCGFAGPAMLPYVGFDAGRG
ncbi:hypothetical protein Dimus_003621 [Dionaea muscipula]